MASSQKYVRKKIKISCIRSPNEWIETLDRDELKNARPKESGDEA